MIVEHRIHRLARLANADTGKRFDRLFREITQVDFLMYAFEQIKDNKGAYTPGVDGKTRREWNPTQAARLAAMLKDGTYVPQPVRRTYIPKKSGKLRPLGIPTFADRVVQSAIKLILEALYEPIFRDCSHGFRPARGCYTALASICDAPKVRVDWVVEGDIQGFFDNVNHQILLRLLLKRIKDDRFLKLIAQFLKAGYFERALWNPTKKGTPQGGIVSPILANIYLHELDVYIEETFGANQTEPQTPAERRERLNPEYKEVTYLISRTRRMLRGEWKPDASEADLRARLRALLKRYKTIQHCVKPIKPRITYTRYADDWVIALRNLPKTEAERIKADITQWLWEHLRLVLSPEKTAITHITDGFVFLGYKIIAKKTSSRTQPWAGLSVPYASAHEKIQQITELCAHSQTDEVTMIRKINARLQGWMNYYACATAPSRIFKKVLSRTFWLYGHYVAKKHDMYLSQAAQRWIGRCPPTRQNPRGGQKTWRATSCGKDGKEETVYLICSTPGKRQLQDAARNVYRKGIRNDVFAEVATCQ